jgi:hypothetical protein
MDWVHDSEALPTLLNPLRRKIGKVSGDGAYDTRQCYQVIERKRAKPTILPRKNAGYWEESGYYERSLSETAMYRYKLIIHRQAQSSLLQRLGG